MELYKKSFFRKKNNKKLMIIVAVAAVAILITVIAIIVAIKSKNDNSPNEGNKEYNTNLTGDASLDPENVETEEEEGTVVEVEELTVESGRSNGIDVSKWQGKIDWQKVKNSGIEFAFIRIGYRGENGTIYKDDNADYNIQQAQKAGVLVGVYFFSTAVNETEAKEEAEWTLQAIKGYKISYPVVYDCEGYKVSTSRMFDLSSGERTDNAMMFLKTVSDAGYDVMFYGAINEIEDATYWDITRIEKKYKVWVAHYSSVAYPEKEKPDYANRCHAWQYTNKGSVDGISGNVDMVVCYFTKEEAPAKDASAAPETAKAPLTDEEKLYTAVNEQVTAKAVTNLRDAATTKSNIVVALKNGEVVTRIGVGKNGWSKLNYNGKTVYGISSYLTTDLTVNRPEKEPQIEQKDIVAGHTFSPKNDKVTAKEFVNLRALPTTDSDKVGTLNSGEFLERTAVSDKGWSRLIYNGQVVYAVTSYLSNEVIAPKDPTPPTSDDGFTAVDEQVTAKEETNLRTKPTTDGSEIVYTLKHGEYVKRIGVHSNGWSKLEYNGQIVYAITSYLTK